MYFIFLISILIHEISHILTGKILGYNLKKIVFLPLGAYIEFKESLMSKRELKSIIVFVAGPVSNLILCYLSYIIHMDDYFIYTNLVLGIFNLLPILPLDGGNILRKICIYIYGYKKGNVYTCYISKFILCILTFFYSLIIIRIKNLSLFFILLYLWYINVKEEKNVKNIVCAYKVIENYNI